MGYGYPANLAKPCMHLGKAGKVLQGCGRAKSARVIVTDVTDADGNRHLDVFIARVGPSAGGRLVWVRPLPHELH